MAGLLCGLILTLWIGFGQPKPKPPFKPLSVEGCPAANASLIVETVRVMENSSYSEDAVYFDEISNISVIVPLEDEMGKPTVPVLELNSTVPEER